MLARLLHVGLSGLLRFVLAVLLVAIEATVRVIVFLVPGVVLRMFGKLWKHTAGKGMTLLATSSSAFVAPDDTLAEYRTTYNMSTTELAEYFGYHAETHVALTSDGYFLVLHRVRHPSQLGKPSPPVLLQHGLLQNSETWVCTNEGLAFYLADRGYDVWLANVRGNRYSSKHERWNSLQPQFWNYSLDEHARIDLPTNIDYVLRETGHETLGYIGFSQGSAMGFAGFSLDPHLARRVNMFIALSPAARAKGLQSGLLRTFVDVAPDAVYLLFGNRAIVPSAVFWRNLLSPAMFVRTIDVCVRYLFGWHMNNMSEMRKRAHYCHLYSTGSVKTVVHWFQIVIAQRFQAYDDDLSAMAPHGEADYAVTLPITYPVHQIECPMAIVYGDADTLPDFDWLLSAVPKDTHVECIPGYEHMDTMWADDCTTRVFPSIESHLASGLGVGPQTAPPTATRPTVAAESQ